MNPLPKISPPLTPAPTLNPPPRFPGAPLRISALPFLALWVGVALWGWSFADASALSSSPLAQRFVNAVTALIPWLDGVRAMGTATDNALLLQCVSYVVCAPVAIWHTLASAARAHQRFRESPALLSLLLPLGSFLFVLLLHARMASTEEQGGFRLDHWVFADPWTAPLFGPVVAFGAVGLPTLFCYLMVMTLADTPSRSKRT